MINKILSLNAFNFNNIWSFLNTQFGSSLISSIIGPIVTIFGVYWTISNDRKSRKQERKDEIRPTLSIQFLGIEDDVKNLNIKNYKKFINRNTFVFFPIFQDIALNKYPKKAPATIDHIRLTNLLFKIHTDGNFPVKNIYVTKINVTNKKSKKYIHSLKVDSSGYTFPRISSAFDLFHLVSPANFSIDNGLGWGNEIIDTNDLNTYISPGTDIILKIPIQIGEIELNTLIKFIKTNPFFNRKEYKKGPDYAFNNPEYLTNFLFNFASFPIQTTINFKYYDIDDNCYNTSLQCYAGLKIKLYADSKFILTGEFATKGFKMTKYKKILDDFKKNVNSGFSG